MLLNIDGQQFHIKGVFEYDPLNPYIYENGDIVYVPGDPKLYIYYNDSNALRDYANHSFLYPLWYKDVVTDIYDYVAAEVLKEWQLAGGSINSDLQENIRKFLKRPVAAELLASILNAKFGTGILTPDGNEPLDLNKICRNGRYVIILGNISNVNNLPSVITTNFLSNPPYPNNIIGLDVWVGRKYASPPPNSNGNEVIISGYVIRQTVFAVLDDKMIIATRSGNVILDNQVTLTVSYDTSRNIIILNPPQGLPEIMDICGDDNTTWNDWTVLQQYPVNILFNYFANRIDTLITSFNHATDRMVLGIRPLNYRLVSMPSSDLGAAPDNDNTPGNICLQINLSNIPMSLHSLSQISAVVVNAVIVPNRNSQEFIQQFTIPIPYSKPLTSTPYLPNSKIVFSGDTKFYVFYTPWASSTTYGVVLNIISDKWDFLKGSNILERQSNITDIILLT
jgi:hypothetical protein